MRRQLQQRPDNFALNMSHPLAQGLVFAGLGQCPGSTRYADASPYGRHGALTNMDPATDWVWADTLGRRCLDFASASSQYVAGVPILIATGKLLISAWIKPTAVNVYQTICGNDPGGTAAGCLLGFGNTSGKLLFYIRIPGGGSYGESSAVLTANEWQHVAVGSSTGGAYTFYRNGIACGTYSNADSLGVSAWHIGTRGPIVTTYMNGSIADNIVHVGVEPSSILARIADPSNVMLSGLIQPPKRKYYALSTIPSTTLLRYFKVGKLVLQ